MWTLSYIYSDYYPHYIIITYLVFYRNDEINVVIIKLQGVSTDYNLIDG